MSSQPTATAAAGGRGWPRSRERGLLLSNLLLLALAILAAWAPLRHSEAGARALLDVARELIPLWAVFLLVHAALAVRRIESDEYLLPLLSLMVLIGGLFHLGLDGPGGSAIRTYRADVLIGVVTAGAVMLLAGTLRRLSRVFEERVWWRVARDVPYYPSVPFHLGLLALMVVLMLWLIAGGRAEGGALVRVPLFGGQSFTPSEFIRLAVAFFLAQYLAANGRVLRNLRQPLGRVFPLNRLVVVHRPELVTLLTMLGLYGIFFFGLRDLGPAAIIFALTLLCLYVSTNLGLTPLLLLGAGVVGGTYLLSHGSSLFAERVAMWRHPWNTSFPHGDHLARMLWGVASGGPFGIGAGTLHLRPLLPEAARDTAFPAIATTLGLWSGLALLLLFAALTWRGLAIGRARPDDEGRLLAFSLTTLLTLEAVWICAAGVGMLPLSGIDLPFVSTGLSSMLASCIALGALLNLSRPESGQRAVGTGQPSNEPLLTTHNSPPTVADTPLRRLAYLLTAAYVLPAAGLIAYGTPFLLGDQTLMRPAAAIGRRGERTTFTNPYMDRFRAQFDRGGIYTRDGQSLAVTESGGGGEGVRGRGGEGGAQQNQGRVRPLAPSPPHLLAPSRVYPFGAAAAQLVGWTSRGRFEVLPDSVEAAYDGPLRGYREADLPHLFRQRDNPFTRRHWPRPHDVYLTLDGKLQQYAALRLREAIREARGSGGAALVMDAGSGEVLAAVSAPSFDPNGLTVERMQRLIRADQGRGLLLDKPLSPEARFFPGSTFKLVTAAAALRDPVEGSAACDGANRLPITWEYHGIRYRRRSGAIHDFSRGGHGTLSLSGDLGRALSVSCNVFFATLAAHLGPEALRDEMLRCEIGRVPSEKELASYLPEAGFGQIVVKVAPVEMARIAAAAGVARLPESEAAVPQPYWVRNVSDARGHTLRVEGLPGAPRTDNFQPFEPTTAHRLRAMMLDVVNQPWGTAYHAFHERGGGARLPGITIGGKTGTAELDVRVSGRSGRRREVRRQHAWFVGFAQNESEVPVRTIAFTILVENLRGRQTGGAVCAPVARDLIAQVFHPMPARITTRRSLLGTLLDQGRRAIEGWLRRGTVPH